MSLYIDSSEWNCQTDDGIPYKLYEGYPQGSIEEEDGTITEKYIIEAHRLADFIDESFSTIENIFPGSLKDWKYKCARKSPAGNQFESVFVTKKISFEPFPNDLPTDPWDARQTEPPPSQDHSFDPAYTHFLIVTIEYGVGKTTQSVGDILEINCNATGEFILIPNTGQMSWDGLDEPILNLNVPVAQVVPGIEWTVKFRRIIWTDLPLALTTCRKCMGCVNNTKMVTLMKEAAIETMLFVGFSWTTKYTWRDTMPVAELELKLLEKFVGIPDPASPENPDLFTPGGHNHFFNPKEMKWMRLLKTIDKGNPTEKKVPIYNPVDLNVLFKGSE